MNGVVRAWSRRELEEAVLADRPEGRVMFKTRITATFLLQLLEWFSARRGQSAELIVAEGQADPLEVELKFFFADGPRVADIFAHDAYVNGTGEPVMSEVEELEVEVAVLQVRLDERTRLLAAQQGAIHQYEQPYLDEGHEVTLTYPHSCSCGWRGTVFPDIEE